MNTVEILFWIWAAIVTVGTFIDWLGWKPEDFDRL